MFLNVNNFCTFLGRLVKDPELSYVGSGDNSFAKVRFTLAVDKNMSKDQKEKAEQAGRSTADFINCEMIGKKAEAIANHFSKGKPIKVVAGYSTYTTQKDGATHYGHFFDVVDFSFVPNDSTSNSGGGGQQQNSQQSKSNTPADSNDGFFPDFDDSEIPF